MMYNDGVIVLFLLFFLSIVRTFTMLFSIRYLIHLFGLEEKFAEIIVASATV